MKKKVVSVLLSAAMVTAMLAGCGGGSDEAQQGDAAASGEKQTVALRMWGAEEDQDFLKGMVESFVENYADVADITVELIDKPGQLVEVSSIIADKGANVTGVFHDKNGNEANINNCTLRVKMETRDHEHIEEIKKDLAAAGFKILGAAND